MKTVIFFLFLSSIVTAKSVSASSHGQKDTLNSEIDSLDNYNFDKRNCAIFLENKQVDFSVVFDPKLLKQRKGYHEIDGTFFPYDAIARYGEKYRKGLLIYKKESEGNDDNR